MPPDSLTCQPSQSLGVVAVKSYAGRILSGRIVSPVPLPSPLRAMIVISAVGPDIAPCGGTIYTWIAMLSPGSRKGISPGKVRFHPTASIEAER